VPGPADAHPTDPVTVREATPDDVPAVSAVQAAVGRASSAAAAHALQEAVLDPDRLVVVALAGGDVVGWAKTHHYPDADGPAPAGHYLGGIAVAPDARRLGAGTLLTQARLDWIRARSDTALYFANARNAASLALHARWGFVEVARGAAFRGVSFDGGTGILLSARLG